MLKYDVAKDYINKRILLVKTLKGEEHELVRSTMDGSLQDFPSKEKHKLFNHDCHAGNPWIMVIACLEKSHKGTADWFLDGLVLLFRAKYSLNSKAFRVFNSRTRIVEENLHIRFSGELPPNAVGRGTRLAFDIDALTKTMNYEPIVAGTQSNGFTGIKASDNAGQARKETEPSSHDDGSKPSSDDGKKVDEDPRKDSKCNDQEKKGNVNSTNNVNAASINEVNAIGGKTSIELPFDPNMPALEDYSIFDS
ncbi:hypothetical protein Tco_0875496 [Tanacetum coccineum]|uniref:Uncharacterized protein n=1 Tax=Tanacetum coccineum TaxID=301880 RepID=A0ABQ5BPT2_9ASTR